MTHALPWHGSHVLPPRLLLAYRRTRYVAGSVAVAIGERSAAADALLADHAARTAVLLTAWNPASRRMPAGWNHRMQQAMAAWLRGRAVVAGEGAWRRWREAHLLVIGGVAPMVGLARRFRQHAIVVLARGRPARLVAVTPPARGACATTAHS
ncbi:MAG: DUF3293 domain-containing protein [Acetobacteraceae bacterium]|nr:DUF3293 domain-containing protein [Acetobacteraceae bacterium]